MLAQQVYTFTKLNLVKLYVIAINLPGHGIGHIACLRYSHLLIVRLPYMLLPLLKIVLWGDITSMTTKLTNPTCEKVCTTQKSVLQAMSEA